MCDYVTSERRDGGPESDVQRSDTCRHTRRYFRSLSAGQEVDTSRSRVLRLHHWSAQKTMTMTTTTTTTEVMMAVIQNMHISVADAGSLHGHLQSTLGTSVSSYPIFVRQSTRTVKHQIIMFVIRCVLSRGYIWSSNVPFHRNVDYAGH